MLRQFVLLMQPGAQHPHFVRFACGNLRPDSSALASPVSPASCRHLRPVLSMPSRNKRRQESMTAEQYQDFKDRKRCRHALNALARSLQKTDAELASMKEQHTEELAAMQRQPDAEHRKLETVIAVIATSGPEAHKPSSAL